MGTIPGWVLTVPLLQVPARAAFAGVGLVTIVVLYLWYRWQRDAWRDALPRARESWRVVLVAALCCLASSAAERALLSTQGVPFGDLEPAGAWRVAALVMLATLSVPLVEEALFRGVLLARLGARYGATAGVVVSGVAFGLTAGDPARMAGQIAAGIVLGAVVVRTRRLWLAAAAHSAFALSRLVEQLAFERGVPERLGVLFPIMCVVVAAIAALELRRMLCTTRWFIPPRPASLVAPPVTWGLDATSDGTMSAGASNRGPVARIRSDGGTRRR